MSKCIYMCVLGEVDSSPFAPRSKMINPVVGAAIIGGAANVLGNVLGFGSNNNTNKTNLQIARETNAQQYKMFQEQNAFNVDMWNRSNEYNLPVNQVERLKAAGINPSSVFGSGSLSQASAIQSATAPQLHTAQVRPFTPDFSGIGDSVNAFFENQMRNKATQGTGIDNQAKMVDLQYRAMKHIGDLLEQRTRINTMITDQKKNNADSGYLEKQREYLEQQISLFKDNYNEMVRREKLQNDVLESQDEVQIADAALKRAQGTYQNLLTKYYPSLTNAEIAVKVAQFKDLMASAALKVKQGELTNAQAMMQYMKNGLEAQLYDMKFKKNQHKSNIYMGSRVVRGVLDAFEMMSESTFGTLKLFGK